jgi:CDP-diacylglycerol---glycerol-3-phosphate 3-phosphatidyltransferase
MANLITSVRLLLLFLVVFLAYEAPPWLQLADMPLLVVAFVLDAFDGSVARRRNEVTLFGSVYDIAADRITENVLWLQLVDLDLVPAWVAVVFLARGFLVDSIRGVAASHGIAPFDFTTSKLGHFLVASRAMRGTYGGVKGTAFGWIYLMQPLPALLPAAVWTQCATPFHVIAMVLICASVALCLLRAAPVVMAALNHPVVRQPAAPRRPAPVQAVA